MLSAKTRHSGLNILWAREKISQLTRDKRRASMRLNSSAAEQQKYKSLITKTALAHHLVSQYTSLIAVDVTPTHLAKIPETKEKMSSSLPKGTLNQRIQLQGSLPQTATPAQLRIITGLFLMGLSVCMHLLTRKKAIPQNSYL